MGKKYPSYAVSRELPGWVKKGQTQFQNYHAGPAEVAKGILTQSSTVGQGFDELMAANGLFCGRLTPELIWERATKYSEAFLDEMRALGKTLIQVNWSCGFSTQSEAIQRQIVTEFTRKAHQRGMRICAYLSLTNIFWKDALEHEPHLGNMLARYSDGRPHLYAYSRARHLACVNQPGWLDYLKNKVRMVIEEADVDAVYFDNLVGACACERCKGLFAEFTERLVGKGYELPAIEQELPPAVKREGEEEARLAEEAGRERRGGEEGFCRDYLHRRFVAHRWAEALKELRDYAFGLKFPLAFSANNHLYPFVNDVCNVLYSQDTRTPGPLWSNIPLLRYLAADSDGWKPVVTNHALGDSDPRLSMAEAIAFQSYPYGINHRPYNLFYQAHPELFSEVEAVAKIGVIMEWPRRRPHYLQPLALSNLLYEVIVLDKWSGADLDKYEVILLPDLEAVSDELLVALQAFAAKQGTVIATGMSGSYDEFGRRRASRLSRSGGRVENESRLERELVERTRQASNPQCVEVDGPPLVVVNLVRKTDDSAYVLHAINYSGSPAGPVKVRIRVPNRALTHAMLFSPDESAEGKRLPLADGTSVSLDKVDVYSAVLLT
jgi:hypothetical protein